MCVIDLTKDACKYVNNKPAEMIVNLVTFKVIVELDDFFAEYYLKLVV
jgi:hypothetical protein